MQFSALIFFVAASVLQDASTFFLRSGLNSAIRSVEVLSQRYTVLPQPYVVTHRRERAPTGCSKASLSSTGYELVKALSSGCWLDDLAKPSKTTEEPKCKRANAFINGRRRAAVAGGKGRAVAVR